MLEKDLENIFNLNDKKVEVVENYKDAPKLEIFGNFGSAKYALCPLVGTSKDKKYLRYFNNLTQKTEEASQKFGAWFTCYSYIALYDDKKWRMVIRDKYINKAFDKKEDCQKEFLEKCKELDIPV